MPSHYKKYHLAILAVAMSVGITAHAATASNDQIEQAKQKFINSNNATLTGIQTTNTGGTGNAIPSQAVQPPPQPPAAKPAVPQPGNRSATAGIQGTTASAQYTLLQSLPCIQGTKATCTDSATSNSSVVSSISLEQFIPYAYKFLLALAVVLAVFMITVGGFRYMLSESITSKSDAIKSIQEAVFGLLLALCAYIVLYTVDPNLVAVNNVSFLKPIPYTTVDTALNGARKAIDLQLQQDASTSDALASAANYNQKADQLNTQGDTLWNANKCGDYFDPLNQTFDAGAPAACTQALSLYDQADSSSAQAVYVREKAFNAQAVSAVDQQLATGVVFTADASCAGVTEFNQTTGCYNGVKIDANTLADINKQIANIQHASLTFQHDISSVDNGGKQTIINDGSAALRQIKIHVQQAAITAIQNKTVQTSAADTPTYNGSMH